MRMERRDLLTRSEGLLICLWKGWSLLFFEDKKGRYVFFSMRKIEKVCRDVFNASLLL